MGISEKKMQIVINNYFKQECDVNTSIREAFEKGFRIGVKKGQSAQPEPHWIPCSERLPKKTGYYLTTNEYKVVHEDYYWGSGCFEKARKYQCEVVAWMPMPIPPYCGDNGE